ncbi:uncharacterized protein DUF3794 [Orenia metallireducens]|jgi:nucleoid-associated protein YgaU|uniref:LysM domain-containing protein n=1 Tax=Orenia metallireducens TaxID=1413210 RepID=A0A285F3N9_9FIRM|nr:SPOCS domain-containing protein [Orenia metallireducens]PRX34800.1 uncharacterized protein DUF3794 [Orenia metallireducens]SNY05673.1 protein of unknown function [Orenia metallireducens]
MIDFKEEQVRVEYLIGEDTVTESITKNVPIPVEAKPDIEEILEVKADLMGVMGTVEDGGVTINGLIELGVMYVADTPEGDQPVHFFEGEFTFTNFVDIPEAEEYMDTYVNVDILKVNYNFVDDRTVEVTVVIRKFAKVFDYRQINIITEVEGIRESLVEKELLRIEHVIGENTYQTVVEGIIEVPTQKPDIERILKINGALIEDEIAGVIDDAIIVGGVFRADVTYVADTPEGDQPVHAFEGEVGLTEVIEVAGAKEGLNAYADITIKRWDYNVVNGNQLEIRALVDIFVKVTETKQIEVVTAINSDQVEVEEELLRVEEVIGEDTVTETIIQEFSPPPVKPNIEQVLQADVQLFLPVCTVEEGGVLVEGLLVAGVLYVAATPEGDQPVHFFDDVEEFENFVNIPGAEAGMFCYGNIDIKKVKARLIDDRTVELSIILNEFIKVINFRQLTIVTDIIGVTPGDDQPSDCPKKEYTVQAGDTLYKIAKRYGTTVDAILAENEIEDPDYLEVGQRLIIPNCMVDNPRG